MFLELALQDSVNWSKAKKSLENDVDLLDSIGKKTLSMGYLQATYKKARHKLNMQRSVVALRPDYDYSEETRPVEEYGTIINVFGTESAQIDVQI